MRLRVAMHVQTSFPYTQFLLPIQVLNLDLLRVPLRSILMNVVASMPPSRFFTFSV
jgi:hypothetical protein